MVPRRLEQVQRQAAVHAAAEQHRNLQRRGTWLTPAGVASTRSGGRWLSCMTGAHQPGRAQRQRNPAGEQAGGGSTFTP